jgi:alpha-mannosidase
MQASLLTGQAGFDAVFFARADYQDVQLRLGARKSELVWGPARSWAGAELDVFCGTFPNHYGPPPGFNFDWGQDDPVIQVRGMHMLHQLSPKHMASSSEA